MESQRQYLPILFNCVNHEKLKEAGYELIVGELKDWSEQQIVIKDLYSKDKFYFVRECKKLDRKENSKDVDLIDLYENISLFEQHVSKALSNIRTKYYKIIYQGKDIYIDFGYVFYDDVSKPIHHHSIATFNLTSLSEYEDYLIVFPILCDFFSFLDLRETNIKFYLDCQSYIDDITGERYNKTFIAFKVYKDETKKELLHTIKFQIA